MINLPACNYKVSVISVKTIQYCCAIPTVYWYLLCQSRRTLWQFAWGWVCLLLLSFHRLLLDSPKGNFGQWSIWVLLEKLCCQVSFA